jgi:NitT/TauT family transport system permease protein
MTRPALSRPHPVDFVLVAAVAAIIVGVLAGRAGLHPYNVPELDLRPALLPLYLLFSLARLSVTLVISVLLALPTGYLAYRSPLARRLILPILDIFQSVPVLGFFPVAVWACIGLFGGSALGVETAAVFLIFTSMFWNLAFGVYESLITVPEDVTLAATQFGLRGSLRWSRLILPVAIPSLVYNSLVSWANGWFFLIASEIIAAGPARYTLPGLGSYLAQAVTVGRNDETLFALLALLTTTLTLHLLLWGPLQTWAERFHLHETGDHPKTPRIAGVMRQSRIVAWMTQKIVVPAAQQLLAIGSRIYSLVESRLRWMALLFGVLGPAIVGYAGWRLYRLFSSRAPSPGLRDIPGDLLLSLARVALGVLLSAVASIPIARWIARHRRFRSAAIAIIQILAAVPATAFFPIIVILIGWGMGMNAGSVLLALTTMIWYVLFNVVGAANAIPKEIEEAARSLGVTGLRYYRRLFVPAVLPSLITGCLTAWGAGWNAMILCEYVEANHHVYTVRGIGATLDRATYLTGDMQVIWASLAAMVLLIVLVNRFFWDALYAYTARRYTVER